MKIRFYLLLSILMCFIISTKAQYSPDCTTSGDGPCYKKEQIVYSLNVLSNFFFQVNATENEIRSKVGYLQKVLDDKVTKTLIGDWDVIWGPVIYFSDSACLDAGKCAVDNLLVLFKYQGTHNTSVAPDYVLATSGTNSLSRYGWFGEDFDVFSMKSWNTAVGTKLSDMSSIVSGDCSDAKNNCVSVGTSNGLKVLLDSMSHQGSSIAEFFKSEFGNNTAPKEIAVAGHSLGGALSPSLAMALKQYQKLWAAKPNNNVTMTAWPTAGASPGTKAFRTYFYNHFKGKFHGTMNSLDLVPHAWADTMLQKIPSLYDPNLVNTKHEVMDSLISKVRNKIKTTYTTNEFATLYSKDNYFTGQFNPNLLTNEEAGFAPYLCVTGVFKDYVTIRGELGIHIDSWNKCKGVGVTLQYLAQAGFQHVEAYSEHFGIEIFGEVMKMYKKQSGLSTKLPDNFKKDIFSDLEAYIKNLD